MRQDVLPLSQIHMEKPWDMNGEAWARERQFFIQMEKRPYMNNLKKSYIKEQINQLLQETNANGTKDYAYDHRGNLLSVTSGEEEKETCIH
jgi:YD repeat-containing protein